MEGPVEKFEKVLLSKLRNDLQKSFFEKDHDLISIPLDIVRGNGKKLIPFRNKACTLPTCVYDLEEIMDKFKFSGCSEHYEFSCQFCGVSIKIKEFFLDVTLASEITKIWETHNLGKNILVSDIQQFKDGHCEYTLQDEGKDPKSNHQGEPGIDDDSGNEQIDNMAKINEFNKKDFSNIYGRFASGNKNGQVKAQPFGINITKQEIDNIMNDYNTSLNIMAFFTRYVKMNIKNNQSPARDFIFAFIVDSYDKYERKLSFDYLQTFRNQFKNDPKKFLQDNQKARLFLVYQYEERWMVSVIDVNTKKCIIFDFLASDLSNTSKDELYSLVKAYLSEEFRFKTIAVSFYDRAKCQTYSDCGLYVCRFLANSLINGVGIELQSVAESEKNTFKAIIPWLILKVHYNEPSEPLDKDDIKHNLSPDKNLGDITKNFDSSMHSAYLNRGLQGSKSPHKQLTNILGNKNSKFDGGLYKKDKVTFLHNISSMCKDLSRSGVLGDELSPDRGGEGGNGTQRLKKNDSSPEKKKKIYSKAELKRILKNNQEEDDQDFDNAPRGRSLYRDFMESQEYPQSYNQQVKQAGDLYNMLTFFQDNNPELYMKVAKEMNEQVENKMLQKFNLLHLKQSVNQSSSLVVDHHNSKFFKKLPPIASLQKADFNAGSLPRNASRTRSPDRENGMIKDSPEMKNHKSHSILTKTPELEVKKPEIVAKRYGIEISRKDLKALKEKGTISKSIFSLFFGFLQEKQAQIPKQELIMSKLRIFPLGPHFYDLMTNKEPYSMNMNYEAVKDITQHYQGQGSMIFDIFDKIVIVVRGEGYHHVLVYIDNPEKKIFFFDPNGRPEQSPVNHPVLFNIAQYIEIEHNNKAGVSVNLAKWRFIYRETAKLPDLKDSASLVAKMVHTMYTGGLLTNFTQEELGEFNEKLVALIKKIGITKNQKGELGDLERFSL